MAEPRPMSEPHSAMLLAAKYVQGLERNQQLYLCCRHVDGGDGEHGGHTAQWFATDSAERQKIKKTIEHEGKSYPIVEEGEQVPDLLIITCGKCGRKHRRWFLTGGDRVVIKESR